MMKQPSGNSFAEAIKANSNGAVHSGGNHQITHSQSEGRTLDYKNEQTAVPILLALNGDLNKRFKAYRALTGFGVSEGIHD
jgi:hypothetical protein